MDNMDNMDNMDSMGVLKQFEDAHTFIIFDHCYECLSLITSISTLSLSMT